jgi:hypothetical protein
MEAHKQEAEYIPVLKLEKSMDIRLGQKNFKDKYEYDAIRTTVE